MRGPLTVGGVPVAPGKGSNRERNFKPGYTGQQDKYGLDVPSEDLNDYYNPNGTYSLMEGGKNVLTGQLKSLKNAAWEKYKMDLPAAQEKYEMDLAAAQEKYEMERAVAEKDKRNMNNIKRRHPNLIQKLNDKFRAVSNIRVEEEPGAETPVARALFGNSPSLTPQRRQKKTRRQRRQRKTRRQRK